MIKKLSILARALQHIDKDKSNKIYNIINKISSLPASAEIKQFEAGSRITPELIKENMKLKQWFSQNHDKGFFDKNFDYYHFFSGTIEEAVSFLDKQSPMEISVVAIEKNKDVCSIDLIPFAGSRSIILKMKGEPTSAFYYDATSTTAEYKNQILELGKDLGLGIEKDKYEPKIVDLHGGNLKSFFWDETSYRDSAANGQSDYHEVILKNGMCIEIILTKNANFDAAKEYLDSEELDKYDNIFSLCYNEKYISKENSFEIIEGLAGSLIIPGSKISEPRIDYDKFNKIKYTDDGVRKIDDLISRFLELWKSRSEIPNEAYSHILEAYGDPKIKLSRNFDAFVDELASGIDIDHLEYYLYNLSDKYKTGLILQGELRNKIFKNFVEAAFKNAKEKGILYFLNVLYFFDGVIDIGTYKNEFKKLWNNIEYYDDEFIKYMDVEFDEDKITSLFPSFNTESKKIR